MSGFNWNQFYTLFKSKLEKTVTCTVGRYVTPRENQFPYVDLLLGDISGGNYDLECGEGSVNPLVVVSVYCNGALADGKCYSISEEAKKLMLSYGFQCRGGPMPVDSTDESISRWVGRYQRIFGTEDELFQIEQ